MYNFMLVLFLEIATYIVFLLSIYWFIRYKTQEYKNGLIASLCFSLGFLTIRIFHVLDGYFNISNLKIFFGFIEIIALIIGLIFVARLFIPRRKS